tara:strand:+ start:428 stop:598 length:171 start_codon:yes stop_codon:yes gene_type:complete
MKVVNPLSKRDGLIAARASTEERMCADKLMSRLNLRSHGALVRQLLAEKAAGMGVS